MLKLVPRLVPFLETDRILSVLTSPLVSSQLRGLSGSSWKKQANRGVLLKGGSCPRPFFSLLLLPGCCEVNNLFIHTSCHQDLLPCLRPKSRSLWITDWSLKLSKKKAFLLSAAFLKEPPLLSCRLSLCSVISLVVQRTVVYGIPCVYIWFCYLCFWGFLRNNILAYTNATELLWYVLSQSFHRWSLTCKSFICFELVVLCNWWKTSV